MIIGIPCENLVAGKVRDSNKTADQADSSERRSHFRGRLGVPLRHARCVAVSTYNYRDKVPGI